MCKLVKHYEQFPDAVEFAVDGDVVLAFYAVIKAVCRERHLDGRDLEPAAKLVKIAFTERPFVPTDL